MPTRPTLHIKRHHGELSEKETDALVSVLADLIVAYLKKRGGRPGAPSAATTQEVHA